MRNWLEDNYVLLTGASGGIGRALAKRLVHKYSARVIGVGRNEDKLRRLQEELGERFSYYAFDVSDKAAWKRFATLLQTFEIRPVLLINNAGIFPPLQKGARTSAELVERVMQVNFYSCAYAIETLTPLLCGSKKYPKGIVNVSSSAALCAVVGSGAYAASKAALKNYTETLQLEEKGRAYIGIVYPGVTATELFREDENVRNSAMTKIATSPEKMAKKIARRIYRRKKRSVVGWDAKCMNLLAKLFPVKGPAFIRWAMKKSGSVAFTNVFEEENHR